jgi:aconitate hydratase
VKAVVAQSFERIHRSNLVGMGVLPLQFPEGVSAQTLGLVGDEEFSFEGLDDAIKPMSDVVLRITKANGEKASVTLRSRIDTAIEVDYFRHGGILPFVLRQLLA